MREKEIHILSTILLLKEGIATMNRSSNAIERGRERIPNHAQRTWLGGSLLLGFLSKARDLN